MRQRAAWRRGVAIGTGVALGVAGLSAPAMAVLDNYPTDPAEAEASVLDSQLLEQEILGAATSDAGFPTNPGPNEANLDVDLLGSQLFALGDIEVPLNEFIDFGQLGALSSVSEASSPLDGHAASGLISADGGLALDAAEGDWGTTTIDLLSLADAAGVGGFTGLAIDQLDLQLGAFGSEVIAQDGVFLDPDGGVTGPGQYVAGDASLLLHSPAIEDAAAQINDLGGQVDTLIEDLANQAFDITALAALIPGAPVPDCTIDSNMQANIVNAVVGQPLTSANQLITLDLSTGQMEIHLEHLVEGGTDPWGGGDDAGLNGLAPNTEVINEGTYPQIAETVHELMEEAAQIMATAVQESLQSITFTCTFQSTGPLPGDVVDVTWGPFTLEDAVSGNFPPAVTNCAGPTAPILCATIATTLDTSAALLSPIFQTVYDFLISDEAAAAYELLINDIKTGLVTQTIGTALSPVFDVINQFVSLQINRQVTETCELPDGTTTLSSLEVSALSFGVMAAGTDIARIGLGNSGVRIDPCNLLAPLGSIGDFVWDDLDGDGIQDAGEPGVEGVTVNLLDAQGNQVATTVTDANGAYSFTDLDLGDYTVQFVAPDGSTFTTPDATDDAADSDADPATGQTPVITLTPAAPDTADVDAGLVPVPTGTIGDFVWDDLDGDGIQDAGEPGVEGVTVNLLDGTGTQVGTTTTDATGAYSFTDLPLGDYTVEFVAPDGRTFTTPDAGDDTLDSDADPVTGTTGTVTLTADAPENLTVDAGLAPAALPLGSIGDFVWDDTNGDGIQDAGEPGVEGVTVNLLDATGAQVGTTTTDANGAYLFTDLPLGDYVVGFTTPNGEEFTTQGAGADPAADSDPDPASGLTGTVTLTADAPEDLTVDAGILAAGGITPTLTADPTEVAPGECTTVTGTGYTPNSTVTVQLTDPAGNPVGDPIVVETDAEGGFTTEVCVPADAEPGDYTIIGTDDTTGTPAETPLTVVPPTGIDPTIAADPAAVEPGGTTTVTGEGYTPNSTVTVQLLDADNNPVGDPITVETDENGAFTTPLTVPEGTEPGDYTVLGVDDTTGTPAETPLTVLEPGQITPSIIADPAAVHPGEETVITGTGYTPDSTATVQLVDPDGNPVGDPITVSTDENGDFSFPAVVQEDTVPGEYTIIGTDDTTGIAAETPLTVLEPGQIAPTLSADPAAVEPGGTTTVTGEGYTPNSTATVQLVDADGNPVGDPIVVETDENGAFTTPLTVPEGAEPGDYTIIGTDDTTGTPAETPLTVLEPSGIDPTIAVDPTELAPGETTTVTGEGYTPNSTVTVQLTDADGNPVGDPITVETDENGAFTTPLTVPEDAVPGDYTVVGTDDTTGTPAETPLTVTPPSGITPSHVNDPAEVPAGETTSVIGEGYTSNSTVTVQLVDADGNPVGDPITVETDENGDFTTPLTVPADAEPGDHATIVTDDTTGIETEAPLMVLEGVGSTPEPILTVDPNELAPGETTTVTGEGYTPNSTATVQLIDPDGNPVGDPIVVETDENGDFTTPLTLPADAEPGDYTVVGTDDTSGLEATDDLTVVDGGADCTTAPPMLVTTTEVVLPGDVVTVTGTGFPAGVPTVVQLHDPSGDPVGDPVTVTPDAACAFELTITIPEDAEPGIWVVVATPEDGSEGAEAPIAVGSDAGPGEPRDLEAWFEHDVREPGQEQTFCATGFEPGEGVSGAVYSTAIELEEKAADADGTVCWTFTVPEGFDSGTHVGIATSVEQGDSALATFEVPCPVCDGNGNGHDDDCGHHGDDCPHGDGDGNGAPGGSDGDGDLAATGSDTAALVALSFLLLAAGATLIRRRQILSRRSQA